METVLFKADKESRSLIKQITSYVAKEVGLIYNVEGVTADGIPFYVDYLPRNSRGVTYHQARLLSVGSGLYYQDMVKRFADYNDRTVDLSGFVTYDEAVLSYEDKDVFVCGDGFSFSIRTDEDAFSLPLRITEKDVQENFESYFDNIIA